MENVNTYKVHHQKVVLEKERESLKKNVLKEIIETIEPYFYIAPTFLIFTIFLFYPFFKTIYLSLYLTDNQGKAKIFIGIKNYTELFTSEQF